MINNEEKHAKELHVKKIKICTSLFGSNLSISRLIWSYWNTFIPAKYSIVYAQIYDNANAHDIFCNTIMVNLNIIRALLHVPLLLDGLYLHKVEQYSQ